MWSSFNICVHLFVTALINFSSMHSYWSALGYSILFIDSRFGVTRQRIALWFSLVSESFQSLSKSVNKVVTTGNMGHKSVIRFRISNSWTPLLQPAVMDFFSFLFLKETDGNMKQLPLLRSSRSFFLCGFSEQLSGSCSLLWQDGWAIDRVTQQPWKARGRGWRSKKQPYENTQFRVSNSAIMFLKKPNI